MDLTSVRRGFPTLLGMFGMVIAFEAFRSWTRGHSTWTPTSALLPIAMATYAGASKRYAETRTVALPVDRLVTALVYATLGISVALLSSPWARWSPDVWDYGFILVASLLTSWWSLGRRWEPHENPASGRG